MPITTTKIARLTGHTGAVYALENSLNENNFFSGSSDHIVAEWNLNDLEAGQMFAKIPEIVYSLKLISENNILLIGQSAGGIHVIDLSTKKETHLLQLNKTPVFDIHYSADHKLIFSVSGDGTFSAFKQDDFSLIKTLKISDEKLRCITIHPVQNEIAIGSGDGNVSVFDLPSLELKKKWQAHTEKFSVNAVQYSPCGNYLLTGSRDARLNIFDVKNNYQAVTSIPAHNYAIYSIVFSPDKKYFATASRDKTIKIWDAETFDLLVRVDKEKFDGHLNSVNKLLWKNNYLISAGDDRSVMVWEIIKH